MSFRISRFFGISCVLALGSAAALSACSSPDGSTPINMGGTDAGTDGPMMVADAGCVETLPTKGAFDGMDFTNYSYVAQQSAISNDGRIMIPYSTGFGNNNGRIWDGHTWKSVGLTPAGSSGGVGYPYFSSLNNEFAAFQTVGGLGDPVSPRIYAELATGSFSVGTVLSGFPANAVVITSGYSAAQGKEIIVASSYVGAAVTLYASERIGTGSFSAPLAVIAAPGNAVPLTAGFLADGSPYVVYATPMSIEVRKRVGSAWTLLSTIYTKTTSVNTSDVIYYPAAIAAIESAANPQILVSWTEYAASGSMAYDSVFALTLSLKTGVISGKSTLINSAPVTYINSIASSGAFNADGTQASLALFQSDNGTVKYVSYDGINFSQPQAFHPAFQFRTLPTVYYSTCNRPMIIYTGNEVGAVPPIVSFVEPLL